MRKFDSQHFRGVLGCYPTGVCIVTSLDPNGEPVGMAVGTFTSVSLDPPLVAFLPNRGSGTLLHIRVAERFCVNILSEQQENVSRVFGGKESNKFAGTIHRFSPSGMPLIDGAIAWIDCTLHAMHEAGDHYIVLGDVRDLAVESAASPLVFHRGGYGQLSRVPIAA